LARKGFIVQQGWLNISDGIHRGSRAAQYVRMSTDHQKYSIQNQSDAIAAYAVLHNLTIVRTYMDEGRSGLRMDSRQALKELISDVVLGHADFNCILVYDISRWGRFQDTDESAHYEFICKEAGVRVEYCAEEFKNDGSLMSNVMKNLKRAMAGEYSRELSNKVFAAQCRLVKMGFWQGGPPGFGLHRLLIDERGNPKGLLTHGQRKHLQSDRVILRPGSPEELELIRDVFRQFALEQKSESEIARVLNGRGTLNRSGRPWTSWTIRSLLVNENYIGNYVYNRKTFRLRQKGRHNSRNLWVRAIGVFEAIVDPRLFELAQQRKRGRRYLLSDRELLARLSSVLREKGQLSKTVIDDAEDLPCHATYIARFGSLRNAYKQIEYYPKSKFDYIDNGNLLIEKVGRLADEVIAKVTASGGKAIFDQKTDILEINGKLAISVLVARCRRTAGGRLRWTVRRRSNMARDLIIALRVDQTGINVMDYLLIPATNFPVDRMEFSDVNRFRITSCRFETIDLLWDAIRQHPRFATTVPKRKMSPPQLTAKAPLSPGPTVRASRHRAPRRS
jgi:DNA invertase Pin-like site-specific DNA recombinase